MVLRDIEIGFLFRFCGEDIAIIMGSLKDIDNPILGMESQDNLPILTEKWETYGKERHLSLRYVQVEGFMPVKSSK